MSFNKDQFKDLIIRTLTEFDSDLCSDAAVNLLLGTAAQESAFGTYLKQIRGPALGVFQMEPATCRWLLTKYEGQFTELVTARFEEIEWNLRLAILMARLLYRAVPTPLPAADDIWGLASYYKSHYNTAAGKATIKEFLHNYRRYVE